jgi:ATP-dependent helicase/nuclease subunit A
LPQLNVIRASAGSGKTYTLASEYLRLLFANPDNFRHILAVTFTNKATNEMKSRIVHELHLMASGKPASQIEDLIQSTGLSENQIRNKADSILKRLLHQYSGFSVSTIDSFFQRIIRSFARELGLQGTYSIELDTEILLTEVIDNLLIRAETDHSLFSWLGDYAGSLIEKGENWNFRKSIRALGKEIFREEFKSISDQVSWQYENRDSLYQFQKELQKSFSLIVKEYGAIGQRAVSILERSGLVVDDFSMKSKGPAGFLVKLSTGEFRELTATAEQAATNPEKWYTRNSQKTQEIKSLAENELMPLMQMALDYYNAHYQLYYTLEAVLKNIYTLGILGDLSQLAYQWCNENNAFLLPEAPLFLQKIIDGNDTPFIYEKAGYWYHHFMIDEFQDTSLLQWLNFKPLISNSLSQGYDNLVVGDVKQSIYRWRNSNWTILANGLDEDFNAGTINSRSLKHNWRSGKKIIDFNNRFFQEAALILDKEFQITLQNEKLQTGGLDLSPVQQIYSDTIQETGSKDLPEGMVQIRFLKNEDEEKYHDQINQKLINLLSELQDQGYHANDIAIITRKNKEAKMLADYLLRYQYEHPETGRHFGVISDEALRLGNSSVVVFLASLMQYLVDPGNLICTYFILSFYKNNLMATKNSPECLLPSNELISRESEFHNLIPSGFFGLIESAGSLSMAEIVEKLISVFGLLLFTGEQVYLNAFRDLVQEYGQKNGADLRKFLEYWEDTGKEKSVSAPAGQDAIRILTVHKSKGLEFNIVIIPYCDWELNPVHNTILWCKPQEPPFSKMGTVPVHFSSKLKKTFFATDYYGEFLNQYIDNLNLLYVSFTRARSGLYVFCKQEKEGVLKNVSNLTRRVLLGNLQNNSHGSPDPNFPGKYDESEACYTYGSIAGKVPVTGVMQDEMLMPANVSTNLASQRIKIAYQGRIYLDSAIKRPKRPINEGKILHEIFTSIRTRDDIIPAVTGMHLHGKINQDEKETYINQLTGLMEDEPVNSWFTGNWRILTEVEIILPEGISKRPDRVMIQDGLTLVIDYKFGEKTDASYHLQVKEYVELLRQMGYFRIEGYLWYVMLGKIEKIAD